MIVNDNRKYAVDQSNAGLTSSYGLRGPWRYGCGRGANPGGTGVGSIE